MIEVEVHSSLRDFLRENGDRSFPHHLTMARLIARALRLGRPTLMQTGSSVSKYCLSYLMPILLGDWSVVIVAPQTTQKYLLEETDKLQRWLGSNKQVQIGDCWQEDDKDFGMASRPNGNPLEQRILFTSPENWLSDRLTNQTKFPPNIPTIIERADNLEELTRNLLTITITAADWSELEQNSPDRENSIRNVRVKLAKSIFSRPRNPYGNHVLLQSELDLINDLCCLLADKKLLTGKLAHFWQKSQQKDAMFWISRPPTDYKAGDRTQDWFTINLAPGEVRDRLKPIWQKQPVVILGGFLDIESTAATYRQRLGLDWEMLSLKFTPNRQNNHIKIYLPNRFPLPNTPDFQSALIEQSLLLVSLSSINKQLIVVIADDLPLQGQVGSALAAEFGTRVKVETTSINDDGILICGWSFWQQHQEALPTPQLVVIATLPIPSLENPLIANRVAYYKNRRKDWFRLYLLPTALKTLEQTVVPLRESQSIIALLDNRVNFRSYGRAILRTLEPSARINYIDPTWFGHPNS